MRIFSSSKLIQFIQTNQQKIALVIGYVLVAALFFNLGKFTVSNRPPDVYVEEPSIAPAEVYDSLKSVQTQFVDSEAESGVAGESTEDCEGKIKGNVGSSGLIYHVPGGSFYKRTNPEMCFETEAEAQAAGFRRSLR